MRLAGNFLWYSYVAILVYLGLTHAKGAEGILSTLFGGSARTIKVLQGRG